MAEGSEVRGSRNSESLRPRYEGAMCRVYPAEKNRRWVYLDKVELGVAVTLPKRAHDRVVSGIRRYQQVFASAKKRDVSESDTAVIIADFLADALGYEKYVEITTEFAIRGTYCDLAVKIGGTLCCLIEVKAIGVELKDQHVKQAIDYAANQGCEWVVLSNGALWRVYRVEFAQPIGFTLVTEIDLLNTSPRDPTLIECFESLSREGFTKDRLSEFFEQKQATSKYSLAAALLSESMLKQLRRELRRIFPGVRADEALLARQLKSEVLKRELVEGEQAAAAAAVLKKLARRMEKQRERERNEANSATPSILQPVSQPASATAAPE